MSVNLLFRVCVKQSRTVDAGVSSVLLTRCKIVPLSLLCCPMKFGNSHGQLVGLPCWLIYIAVHLKERSSGIIHLAKITLYCTTTAARLLAGHCKKALNKRCRFLHEFSEWWRQ